MQIITGAVCLGCGIAHLAIAASERPLTRGYFGEGIWCGIYVGRLLMVIFMNLSYLGVVYQTFLYVKSFGYILYDIFFATAVNYSFKFSKTPRKMFKR